MSFFRMSTNGSTGTGYVEDEGLAGHAPDTDDIRTMDLDIDPPIEINGKPYTRLHLEEPTAQMMERAEAELAHGYDAWSLRKYQIWLVSQGGKLPRAVVEKMRVTQVKKAADFLQSFLASGPETGGT